MSEKSVFRAQLREVVADFLRCRMSQSGWDDLSRLLDRLQVALAAHDLNEQSALTAELILLERTRITRIGEPSTAIGPQPQIRDRLNQLVHSLSGVTVPRDGRPGGS